MRGRGGRLKSPDEFLRRLRQELQRLDRLALQMEKARLDLRPAGLGLGEMQDPRRQNGRAGQKIQDAHALHALAHDMVRAVGRRHVPHDVGDRADPVQIVRPRVGGLRIALHHNADGALLPHRLLDGGDRLRPADAERNDKPGEEHRVSDGQDDDDVRRQGNRS